MKLVLTREIIFPSGDMLASGTMGEPVDFNRDGNGNVAQFDMIFYGYPRIFTNVPVQDLELV